MVLEAKNLPANSGDVRDMSSIPGSGRSPGEGNGYPLQYSYLENPMNRGAWWDRPQGHRVRHDCSDLAHMHTEEGVLGGGTHLGQQSGNLQGTNMSQ